MKRCLSVCAGRARRRRQPARARPLSSKRAESNAALHRHDPNQTLCARACLCSQDGHLYVTSSYSKPYRAAMCGRKRLNCGDM